MAEIKITDYNELKEATADDLFEIVDDVAGTPTSKKIARKNVIPSFGFFPYQLTEHNINVASGFCHTVSLPQSKTISSNSYSLGGDGDFFIKEF